MAKIGNAILTAVSLAAYFWLLWQPFFPWVVMAIGSVLVSAVVYAGITEHFTRDRNLNERNNDA